MTDIGFVLIDRRTVIVVLFTVVLANALFGLQLPIDTSTVSSLFVGLVVLTGYVYLSRSIFRLPVALIASILVTIDMIKSPSRRSKSIDQDNTETEQTKQANQQGLVKKLEKFIRFVLRLALMFMLGVPFFILLLIWLLSSFGIWIEEDNPFEKVVHDQQQKHMDSGKSLEDFKLYNYYRYTQGVFGFLDRVGVIAFAFLATIPSLQSLVGKIGVIGLLLMVAVFTFRGDFTSLVRDILEKDEKEKEEKVIRVRVENSPMSPLYVETTRRIDYD